MDNISHFDQIVAKNIGQFVHLYPNRAENEEVSEGIILQKKDLPFTRGYSIDIFQRHIPPLPQGPFTNLPVNHDANGKDFVCYCSEVG